MRVFWSFSMPSRITASLSVRTAWRMVFVTSIVFASPKLVT